MTGKAEALAVYQQVCALAEDYARALDGPMATMAARAWFGGGAQGFADELSVRRQAAQRAWAQAMAETASLVAEKGGPCLIPPGVYSQVGAPLLRGADVGADVPALAHLVVQLRQAGGSLAAAGTALGAELTSAGLPAGPAAVIGETGRWAQAQASAVGQRLALAEKMNKTVHLSADTVAFGVFASWLPGETGLGALLDQAASGSTAALAGLLERQREAASPDLAIAIATWWRSLSSTVQQRLITADPAAVGALDGLPAVARDQANRLVFSTAYDHLIAEKQQLTAELAGDEKQVSAWEASRLWSQANRDAPAGVSVASVFWLGYTAPQLNLTALDPSESPATADEANAAAPALDSFAAGLAAAHVPGLAAHSAMLGHSYGSLVVGRAAVRWPGKLADDLVFVGSPGVGVDEAGQLGVPAAHVFAGQAGGDRVPDIPRPSRSAT